MSKKFRLLLLDANVVMHAHVEGFWPQMLERCDIYLSETVINECEYYFDEDGQHEIDLKPAIEAGHIHQITMMPSQMKSFHERFGIIYNEKLDPGEAESLAFLFDQDEEYLISSADKIVYRVLGSQNRGEQGISLEEILSGIGLSRAVPRMFSKSYREEWTKKGFQEKMFGTVEPL